MTCHECEMKLALEEQSPERDAHLAECGECRALATEMAANSEALREMSMIEMPSVGGRVLAQVRAQTARRNVMRWGWALAAAAALVVVVGVTKPRPKPELLAPQARIRQPWQAPEMRDPVRRTAGHPMVVRRPSARVHLEKAVAPQEPLKVQMLTSDPDVVIYWLVEPKEGSE